MPIKLIQPEKMKFSFTLTGHDCYRIAMGKCSLKQNKDVENKMVGYSGTWSYCRDLYNAMVNGMLKNNDSYSDLTITKACCGHYSLSNGQHRLCIAKTMKLPIYVNIGEGDGKCHTCTEKEKYLGLTYAIQRLKGQANCFIY